MKKYLHLLRRPGQYLAGELTSEKKDIHSVRVKIVLAFPDLAEIGAANLGITILYRICNSNNDFLADRVFAVAPDAEQILLSKNEKLRSMEYELPLDEFDIIGFSLQHELQYTNVLTMLKLSAIPILSRERSENHPIVIAGGPCAFNPAPLSHFIDLFVIGDGEKPIIEILSKIADSKNKKSVRCEILNDLAKIEGVYIPVVHGMPPAKGIRKAVSEKIDEFLDFQLPVLPFSKSIQERITIEAQRGCVNGCRFCHIGMVARPVRQQNPEKAAIAALSFLNKSGLDELSFLILNTSDYKPLTALLDRILPILNRDCISVSMPSMRVDRNNIEPLKRVLTARKKGFTFAPEVATERMRNIINKRVDLETLIDITNVLYDEGVKSVKLYFMVGLPFEKIEDELAIADFLNTYSKKFKNRIKIDAAISPFVPKVHTPFQWADFFGKEKIGEIISLIKKNVRYKNIEISYHDPRMSEIEAVLSRGNFSCGKIIENAARLGARFDSWSDSFNYEIWKEAIEMEGCNVNDLLRARPLDEPFAWDFVDAGVSREFLRDEYFKASREEYRDSCITGPCYDCGACTPAVKQIISNNNGLMQNKIYFSNDVYDGATGKRIRIIFKKVDEHAFLSQLEFQALILRVLRRTSFPMLYSSGFAKRPKVSFGPAIPVGVESLCELADVHVKYPINIVTMMERLNKNLPDGIKALSMNYIPAESPTPTISISRINYEITTEEDKLIKISIDNENGDLMGIHKYLIERLKYSEDDVKRLKLIRKVGMEFFE